MIKYEHYPTEVEPANIIAEYKYDIYGRRIQKNVNGTITNFHWEGDNMSFELNENNQPIRRYIYENGKDDVQGYVEYSEVDDPQYFSFERKGWYSYIKDQVGTITKVYKHETVKRRINLRVKSAYSFTSFMKKTYMVFNDDFVVMCKSRRDLQRYEENL